MNRTLRTSAFCVVYIAAAKLGLSLASIHPNATAVWPPSGIAIGLLLLLGRSTWPAVFLGAFVANVTTAGSPVTALCIAAGNTLEALTGRYLVQRWAGGTGALRHPSLVFRFAACLAPATMLSPTIGVTALSIAGYAQWAQYRSIWATWWLGDLAGALVVAPMLLAWLQPRAAPSRATPMETTLLFTAVVVSASVVFCGIGPWDATRPLAFLTIPALAWAAFRAGQREATLALALSGAIATWGTLQGWGAFAVSPANTGLLILQTFLATISTMVLAMAAIVFERERIEIERARLLVLERTARAEAEAANTAKDQFLAMLGHELRNPLAAITTAAQVLTLPGPDADVARQAQGIIARQSKHLSRLVDDLLDVARVQTGKITLTRGAVEVTSLIARCVEAIRLVGARDGPRITVSTPPVPIVVDGDATRLEQVVTNLLTNAVKFTPATGVIQVRASTDATQAVVVIEDNGIGIAPEALPRIFDQFMQADLGPERLQSGLGLGLTLVKHLVALHGGVVTASSAGLKHGSVFTVRLPLAASASPPESAPVRTWPAARRVLVVEDQTDLSARMCFAWTHAGHRVAEAADGPGGVQAALDTRPDAAFLDIGLPGFDGYEAARRIRAGAGSEMILIALTGYGRAEDRARALAAGFDAHLVKPVTPAQLTAVLAEVEQKRQRAARS
jgi:signal transduction histidine kinase/ActR/RegA family two-component response regulator